MSVSPRVFLTLSIIGIAQGFFDAIDYRYHFSTKGFIVPISGSGVVVARNLR